MNKIERLMEEVRMRADIKILHSAYENVTKHPYAEYLCLYGSGMVGVSLFQCLSERGINVDFFVESDGGANIGKTICGKSVLSVSELLSFKENILVIIANGDAYKCWKKVKEYGFPYVNSVIENQIRYSEYINDEMLNYLKQLDKLRSICYDDYSFELVLRWLNEILKMDLNFEWINSVCTYDQYFPEGIFEFKIGEHLVDVGAYDGDSIELFAKKVPAYGKIHSIEMNCETYGKLIERATSYRDIICYNIGLSDVTGRFNYDDSKSSSIVHFHKHSSESDKLTEVDLLDNLLNGERVDYIKMDIEGAEISALKGSKKIISEQKPKLAICAYHNPLHVFEIPFLLKQYVPEYKIYFRHHTQTLYELVCYATL